MDNNNQDKQTNQRNGHVVTDVNNKEPIKNEEVQEEMKSVKPPDGGWGWVVVFASFMIHVIADGVIYTIGIFYVEFLKYFHSSKGTTAWVASIMVGVSFCIGPFASALTNKYGCRTVAILGSFIAAFGLTISLFAPNVIFLFFSIGLCAGIGFGLVYLPAIVCVTCYFEKRRAFATGIAVCGSGFGTFAMAPLTELLVETYNWKGAMLIVAGLVLNCILFGALFRPLEHPKKSEDDPEDIEKTTKSKSFTSNEITDAKESDKMLLKNNSSHQITPRKFHPNPRRRNDSINSDIHDPVNGEAILTNGNAARFNSSIRPTRSQSDAAFSNSPMLLNKTRPAVTSSHELRHLGSRKGSQQSNHSMNPPPGSGSGPLARKDIFYSGSLMNIPEYRKDPVNYTNSVVSLPTPRPIPIQNNQSGCWKITRYFKCNEEMKEVVRQMTDTTLLKDPVFLMFCFSNFFTNIGFNVPFVYTKDRALSMKIAEDEEASLLLSVIGIANTAGRVILGYMSDKAWCNRLYLYNMCLTFCGIATAMSALCTTYPLMGLYSAVFGITAGAYVSLTSVILVDLLGLDKLTNAFGLLLVFEGLACLIGPPITGWLYDAFGSYDPGFYVCGVMIALSGLMLFAIPWVKKSPINGQENNAPAILIEEPATPVTPTSV